MSRFGGVWRKRRRVIAVAAVGVAGTTGGADAAASTDTTTPSTEGGETPAGRCIVRLHGKSGAGGESYAEDGVLNVLPDGNAEGWGGRQWIYFPEDKYLEARSIVADAIESSGCDDVIINGFSNGGAFAAKLYCRGETFDGRVVRYVIDDPVPDEAVLDCTPDPTVGAVLYWTGGLAETAKPGWECREADWTCEGGVTIGIDAYAAALGVEVQKSKFDEHEWYWDAPELADWTRLDPAGSTPVASEPASTEP
jgi:pimeloyl-ACP methyl ester carboxylesterase